MRNVRTIWVGLFVSLVFLAPNAQAERYWVFGDSNIREDGISVPVFFGDRTHGELRNLPFRTPGGIVKIDSHSPLKVFVFVPPDTSKKDRTELAKKTKTSLEKRYGTVKVVVRDPPKAPQKRDRKVTVGTGIGKAAISTAFFTQFATGMNPLGFGQAAFASAMDIGTSVYVEDLVRLKENLKIPFAKENAAVKWFNGNDFVKGTVINHAIGLTASTGFTAMAWMNDPTLNAPLSGEFFKDYLGIMGLLDTPFNALGEMWGARQLAKKGYLSKNQEIWLYQFLSFQIQMNYLLFGSQNWKLLPLGLGTSWATRVGLAAVGKTLGPKDNRLWVLHPDLTETERTAITYDQRLEAAIPRELLASKHYDEMMEGKELQKTRPAKKRCGGWFSFLSGRK